MHKYNMPLCEKETHIWFDAESNTASVETYDPVYIRKLDKMVESCPECYEVVAKDTHLGNPWAKYRISEKKLLSFRKPAAVREYTDEQREAMRERMLNVRNTSRVK